MNTDALLETLVRLTLLFSAAVLLLALLRPPLLRALGAQATYLAWLLVPLLLASRWLPLPRLTIAVPQLPAVVTAPVPAVGQVTSAAPAEAAPASPAAGWLLAWAVGATLLATGQALLQRRYVKGLRRGADGQWRAPAGTSPAVVGLWPQRLVLPDDFQQRFDAAAQRLVLAHEAVHARRHDNAWNLLAAVLLCLQWFNPLAWWAWARLRNDQELACDAAVLTAEAGPAPLAAYAEAMLAAHRAPWKPALASAWASRHPLVERVRMLSRHRAASRGQRLAVVLLALGVSGGAAVLARAAQPPAPEAVTPPVGQGLVFEVASQLGRADWNRHMLRLPDTHRGVLGGPWGLFLDAPQAGWCLRIALHGFADGSIRPAGQVLDEACQRALGDWQTLAVNGSVVQFHAQTARGPLQAQLSARWMDPKDPALPELMKADLERARRLSAAQQQMLGRQLEATAEALRQQQAQDRTWREARDAAVR
jgi:beta-lactamase regulating signal transducer with metallopeptidase domain